MPEQQSERALAITSSNFEQPFETAIWPFGVGGLDLNSQLDAIPVGKYSRLSNLFHTDDRALTVRPGLTQFFASSTHSVLRMNDPVNSTYTRVWGSGQTLCVGQSSLTVVDAGPYSGDPLSLCLHRTKISGDPWTFVGDRVRMRKVRSDGLDLPIGLPASGTDAGVSLGTLRELTIADYTGATAIGNWTNNAGYTRDDPPQPMPLPEMIAVLDPDGNNAISFGAIADGFPPKGYYQFWGCPAAMDLSFFPIDGTRVTDDDYIHLWINMSHVDLIDEFRLYLVCSGSFSPNVVPGISDAGGANADAYLKTFSASDFAKYISAIQSQTDAAEQARIRSLRDEDLRARGIDLTAKRKGGFAAAAKRNILRKIAEQDVARRVTKQSAAANDQWQEFGTIGIPLRRGDFQRIGGTENRDWSTITGIIVLTLAGPKAATTAVRLGSIFLRGGSGPDSGEPGAQPYDYRYTHYDPRTGAEGNPSDEMIEADYIDSLRQPIVISCAAYGDADVRQRFYRRGGSSIADWHFLGVNASDGGDYTDEATDDTAEAGATLELDHFEAVPSVDADGNAVLAQPCHTIFGPSQEQLFALGDSLRPGHLYYCIPGEPDHWPDDFVWEVCAAGEELLAGLMFADRPFCFSRARLYAVYQNLGQTVSVTSTPTACKRGIVSRTAYAVGVGGIFGVAPDGIFVTTGGAETIITEDIQRIFYGETVNGYLPVDFAFPDRIRLSVIQDWLYFLYQDTNGDRQCLVYAIREKSWLPYDFAPDLNYLQADEASPTTVILAGGTAKTYTHEGTSDDGTAISWRLRTGCWDLDKPRQDKLLGDQILDADFEGYTDIALQNRLNNEAVTNTAQGMDTAAGRTRFILDSFGETPQRARNISVDISGSSASNAAKIFFLGQSTILEPDVTINRMTQWDDLGHADESYVTGVTFDVDTFNQTRTIIIESDFNGLINTIATLSVLTNGRRKVKFSWAAAQCHKVRIRPSDECLAWILYRADWIRLPEPPRIAGWDIHYEAKGDQYYTGLDIYCDTGGQEKRIAVFVDEVQLTNDLAGGLLYWPITSVGRQWIHLTLPWGRGHVFRFRALDTNPGLLYSHRWYLDPEPSEQANWNQNFSIHGTLADKWFKGFLFEVDTFDQAKTVTIEIDGTVRETLGVRTNGRKVVHMALSQQYLGRVLRVFPTDGNPSRPYTIQPIFDVEPYELARWETQETNFDIPGFFIPIEAQITLRSTAAVTLTIYTYVNQSGTIVSDSYTIPSTSGVKDMRFVPFQPRKGVLVKFVLESTAAFHLHQEESAVLIQPFVGGDPILARPFGNDDQDRTRNMTVASLAAARSGGGSE